MGEDNEFKGFIDVWKDQKIVNTRGMDLVYVNNLLVPHRGERQQLINISHKPKP